MEGAPQRRPSSSFSTYQSESEEFTGLPEGYQVTRTPANLSESF